jgi:hypothetical protein
MTGPSLFLALLIGAFIAWDLVPSFAPALAMLAVLWGIGTHPFIAIPIVIAWLLRRLIADAFIGLAAGIGLRASGAFSSAERAERQRERWIERRATKRRRRTCCQTDAKFTLR